MIFFLNFFFEYNRSGCFNSLNTALNMHQKNILLYQRTESIENLALLNRGLNYMHTRRH